MLSFAGVTLPSQDGPLAAHLNALLSTEDLYDFSSVTYPGENLAAVGWPSQARRRPAKVGTLFFPRDASRFAVGYFIVTNNEMMVIRQRVYANPGVSAPQAFTIADGKRSLTTNLWMLPPRPLTQITGNNDAWLLTLVDDRYWWWQKAANITLTPGTTTWAQLYASVASALGISLTVDSIPSAYLLPTQDFGVGYDALPILLDAIARSVGQRIVRDFAGGVRAWNVTNSATQVAANVGLNPLLAGGQFLLTTSNPTDKPAIVPQAVAVSLPRQDNGVPNLTMPTVYNVTLSSLSLGDFAGITGAPWTKLIRSTLVANWLGGSVASNDPQLQAYANQVATDYYRYAVSPVDATYSGVLNWTPEGLTDSLEFMHAGEAIATRVQRPPWQEWDTLIQAYGCFGSERGLTFCDVNPHTVTGTGIQVVKVDASGGILGLVMDAPGVARLTANLPTTTTTTTNAPSCAGTCRWTWSAATQMWSLFSNGCATTTTTTAAPGVTTTACYSTTSTTTTASPLSCNCLNPTYCGTTDGECTMTNCVTGLLPPIVNCTTSTTTTVAGTTTTTTTTQNPLCTTTLGPGCTQCCWTWNGIAWMPTQGCTAAGCVCPGAPVANGVNCGDQQCFSCVQAPPPPPPSCTGACTWIWIDPPGYWLLQQVGCQVTGTACGPCQCSPPSTNGICGHITQTPCLWQCGSTTTTLCPCGPPYCPGTTTTVAPLCTGSCYWSWNGSAWILSSNTCSAGCNCCQPGYTGQQTCETAITSCNDPPLCPTTTTTSTTTTSTTTTFAPCGTCTYTFNSGCNLVGIANNCTGSCGCPNPPTCAQSGGTAVLSCTPTTTTTAPCGLCTYTSIAQSPGQGNSGSIFVLTSNTCTGGCGCCYYGGTSAGAAGQVKQTDCNTAFGGVAVPCPTTTTAAPTAGQCLWGFVSGTTWVLVSYGCKPGFSCSSPTGSGDGCCTNLTLTPCVSTTTTSTTTAAPPSCGTCQWTWTGSNWATPVNSCTRGSGCICVAPGSPGVHPGDNATTNCA